MSDSEILLCCHDDLCAGPASPSIHESCCPAVSHSMCLDLASSVATVPGVTSPAQCQQVGTCYS